MKGVNTRMLLVIFSATVSLLAAGLALVSCEGDGDKPVVYIAGFALADIQKQLNVPVYWKGDKLIELSRLDPNCDGYAHSIIVVFNNIYIAGDTEQCSADGKDKIPTAVFWKDGVRVDLPKPEGHAGKPSSAYQIAADRGSVYVAGFVTGDSGAPAPVYWKDSRIVYLELPSGARNGAAYNIYINGSDIYTSGVVLFDDFYPVLWKNGEAQVLPRPYEFRGVDAPYPITIDNGNVHVFGTIRHIPSPDWDSLPRLVSWNNGEVEPLTPLELQEAGLAYDGTIHKGVAYRAGIHFEGMLYTPALWVGDTRRRLLMLDENLFGMARDLFIESDNVYVAGATFVEESNNTGLVIQKPCYWVDEKRVDLPTLSPGAAFAYDIFVTR